MESAKKQQSDLQEQISKLEAEVKDAKVTSLHSTA